MLKRFGFEMFNINLSKNWIFRWKEKNSHIIRTRKTKLLAEKGSDMTIIDELNDFIDVVEKYKMKMSLNETTIVNYDETRICYGSGNELALEWKGKERSNTLRVKTKCIASLVPFISAFEEVLMMVVVLKGKEGKNENETLVEIGLSTQPGYETRSKRTFPVYYIATDSGFLNSMVFHQAIIKFYEVWNAIHPRLNVWLFDDQLGAHLNNDSIIHAIKNNGIPFFFPSNCSHFLQPLDSTPFALLKKNINSIGGQTLFISDFFDKNQTSIAFSAIYQACERSFTPSVIKSGFPKTGIWPWNPQLIIENTQKNIEGKTDNSLDESQGKTVKAIVSAITNVRNEVKKKVEKIERQKSIISKNKLYCGFELAKIRENDKKEEEKQKEEKENKRKLKEQKKENSRNVRSKMQCSVDGCNCARMRDGKFLKECKICDILFCQKHQSNFKKHEKEHTYK